MGSSKGVGVSRVGVDVKGGGGLTSGCGRQRGWGVSRWVWTSKGVGVSRVNVDTKKEHMDTRQNE